MRMKVHSAIRVCDSAFRERTRFGCGSAKGELEAYAHHEDIATAIRMLDAPTISPRFMYPHVIGLLEKVMNDLDAVPSAQRPGSPGRGELANIKTRATRGSVCNPLLSLPTYRATF